MKRIPLLLLITLILSCKPDNNDIIEVKKTYTVKLGLTKLPPLRNIDYKYYLWASKNGENKLIGSFSLYTEIEANEGQEFSDYFNFDSISKEWTEEEINITLTINSRSELTSEPSNWTVAKGSGNLSSNSITLSLKGGLFESENQSFLNSKASFFIKAPSINSSGANQNGIWFIKDLPPTESGFENLPVLGENWEYSAWILVDDMDDTDDIVAVPIGKFTNTTQADTSIYGNSFNNEFKGSNQVYPFIGEDFINDPNGKFPNLDFPLDLRKPSSVLNTKPYVMITIRPKSYTDSSKPFPIRAFTKSIVIDDQLSEKITMDNRNLTVGFAASLSFGE